MNRRAHLSDVAATRAFERTTDRLINELVRKMHMEDAVERALQDRDFLAELGVAGEQASRIRESF
jgi:AraC-like DNA-binding protein